MALEITDRCIACAGCVAVCPVEALVMPLATLEVDNSLCIACGDCVTFCPCGALILKPGGGSSNG